MGVEMEMDMEMGVEMEMEMGVEMEVETAAEMGILATVTVTEAVEMATGTKEAK
jgi:hypothetical protein